MKVNLMHIYHNTWFSLKIDFSLRLSFEQADSLNSIDFRGRWETIYENTDR